MDSLRSLRAGRPWPLGSHFDGDGVNFAVFSAHALEVELCIFDAAGQRELSRTPLPGHSHDIWHGYLPGAAPGLVYGLRVRGPWKPDQGHRFNPYKLLLDPYAREIVGRFEWRTDQSSTDPRHPQMLDMHDNAAHALKARVVHENYDWGGDRHPHTPLADTVLYEMHVKGFTKLHCGVRRPGYGKLQHERAGIIRNPAHQIEPARRARHHHFLIRIEEAAQTFRQIIKQLDEGRRVGQIMCCAGLEAIHRSGNSESLSIDCTDRYTVLVPDS